MSDNENNIILSRLVQNPALSPEETRLFTDVCQIIDGAKTRVATYLNSEICMANWYVGTRIKEDVLYNQRAE